MNKIVKKTIEGIKNILLIGFIITIAVTGYKYYSHKNPSKEDTTRIMRDICKVYTQEQVTNNGYQYKSSSRGFLFSTSTADIYYDSVVIAGYDLENVTPEVDQKAKTITITIPTLQTHCDIEIDHDKTKTFNNPFNAIDDEWNTWIDEIESDEIKTALTNGIEQKAKQHLKELINTSFEQYSNYSINYVEA